MITEKLTLIDRNSFVPLYKQISLIIKDLIIDGVFKYGELIPSENELSSASGISRMTVRRGLQELVEECLLEPIAGRGYCATPGKIKLNSGVLRSFTKEVIGMGMVPTSRLIEKLITNAPLIAQHVFEKSVNTVFLKVRRVRYADGIPLALETSFFDFKICKGLETKVLTESIYETLQVDLGIQIDHAHQTIEAHAVAEEEAAILEIAPGDATLLLRRKSFDVSGRTVEYVESIIRGDRYAFTMELR